MKTINVRSKFWSTAPIRIVTIVNNGIQIGEHWFEWDYFFAVNVIVP